MSNIRKSFNFRDGVQVDNDIFVVRGPLVGIGTSVPTEKLDVRGTVSVSGLITSRSFLTNNLYVTGVSTYTNELFVGITSINSGIITASSDSGIVTYYGDGGRLLNLPTSQWLDVDVGLGFTSIYAQGFVGIATFDPRFVFQVGGIATTQVGEFKGGVGISSAGDILATGFATAYSFVGFGTGITNLDADNITDGTLNNARLPETISVKDFIGLGITVSDSALIGSVYITSGLVTSTSGIITYYGDGANLINLNADEIVSGTLDNERLPSDISVSGIITANNGFDGNLTGNVVGDLVGNVTGIASTARTLIGSPDIIVGVVTASGNVSIGGSVGVDKFLAAKEGIISHGTLTAGIATVSEFFNVGTGATISSSGVIGIGTLTPLNDFELKKPSNATISVVSDSGQARIAVGQESGIGDSSAVFRFGNQDRTLDIINYDYGNYNYYLHSGSQIGINTGSFNWLYGKTNEVLATLTYDGKFGIGITNPQNNFEVVGTSAVTGNLYVGSSLYIEDALVFSNGLVLGEAGTNIVLTDVNLNSTIGVTTLSELNILGSGLLGIGTDNPIVGLDASNVNGLVNKLGIGTLSNSSSEDTLYVFGTSSFNSTVGIGTNQIFIPQSEQEEIGTLQIFGQTRIYNNALIFAGDIGGIGIGTENPEACIDLSGAKGFLGERTTFVPPVLTTSERNAMTFVPEGGLIYNKSNGSLQTYNGSSWTTLASNLSVSGTQGSITYLTGTTLNYTGISTISHIRSVTINNSGIGTISVLNSTNAIISGVITATELRKSGGTSSQFLKADGSVDSSTYLTSYTETDTLNTVLGRGNSSSRGISVGVITATNANFSGNVSILGTLTYEDVVNIDAVGLVTARSGVRITGGGLNVTGVSTFAGITTVTGQTLFAKHADISGVSTASSFIRRGGTSSQFLKADGSVDSSTYLTSFTESDTLNTVTNRGNTTSNGISVGIVTATEFRKSGGTSSQFLKADGSVDSSSYLTSYTETDTLNTVLGRGNSSSRGISVGVITATDGFTSDIGATNPVQITVSGNVLTFTVVGIGSTSLTLS
jgi:hypothetical protein